MANYSVLKAAVQAVVKTNGNQEITGANMQSTLISIINSLGTGYQFMGVATPSTSPGTPDYNVAYIGGAGTYANFGTSVTVPVGSIGVFKYNGSWETEQIALFAGIDDVPVYDSDNLIKSGYVYDLKMEVDGEIDNGTTYNTLDPNYSRVCVFYPIPDVDATYHLKVSDIVIESGSNIAFAVRSAATPYTGSVLFYLTNDADFTIPDNYKTTAKYIAVNTTLANSAGSFKVELTKLGSLKNRIDELENDATAISDDINDIENDVAKIQDNIYYQSSIVGDTTITNMQWCSLADGSIHISTNGSLNTYQYNVLPSDVGRTIIIKGGMRDLNSAAIAFFSSTTPSTQTYLPQYSVGYTTTYETNTISAVIPQDCASIVFTSHISYFEGIFLGRYIQELYDEIDNQLITGGNKGFVSQIYSKFLIGNKIYYSHMFMGDTTRTIPNQSLFDVDIAARLGFRYIEANVQKTSDNVLITYHGQNGQFSDDVTDLNGNDQTYLGTAINSVTYDFIKNNIRYKSTVEQYRTYIPTLTEFIEACKRNGISVMMTYNSETYSLAKKYFGDDFIAYGGDRLSGFTGIILHYSGLTSKQEIIDYCNDVGAPYIHMFNGSAINTILNNGGAALWKEIIQAIHDNNCLAGIAGNYNLPSMILQFIECGGDVMASAYTANDFESGNVYNLRGELGDFTDFVTSGTSIDTDGFLQMPSGSYLTISDTQAVKWGVGSLYVRFKGTLSVNEFGMFSDRVQNVLTNDTDSYITKWVSTVYQNDAPTFKLLSLDNDTSIQSVVFKSSKC